MAVVGAFLFACAVLLFVGCAGGRSEAPEEQGHTEATNEQARSPEATTEEAQCEGTRTIKRPWGLVTTNDVPGCPDKGGLLSGTDEADELNGKQGDDEIHGLGGVDVIMGGDGNDIIYGGPGDDSPLWGERGDDVIYGGDGNDGDLGGHDPGDDVIYGGDGNDFLDAQWNRGERDKLYCGEGRDEYIAHKNDYVDSSCEEQAKVVTIVD